MTDYFVSNAGSDAANGLTTSTSWQTLAKVTGFTFSSGDHIYLKRGDRWYETLGVSSNTTIGAYGAAAVVDSNGYQTNAPIIDGGAFITGWTTYSGGVSDSFLTDDFAGTAGALASTSVPEVGNGAWSIIPSSGSTGVFTADGMIRRATTGVALYRNLQSLPNPSYFVEGVFAAKSLLSVDTARVVAHMDPSGVGTGFYLAAGLVTSAGSNFIRVSFFGASEVIHDHPFTITAGSTHTIRIEVDAVNAILYTYVNGSLFDTISFANAQILGDFRSVAGNCGYFLGSGSAPVQSDSTGMQIASFDCGPLGITGAPPTNTYQATLATDPLIVSFQDEYTFDGDGPNLLADREYIWKGGKVYLRSDAHVPTDTDVRGAVRTNAITASGGSGKVIQDVAMEMARGNSLYVNGGSGITLSRVMARLSSGGSFPAQGGVFYFNVHNGATIDGCVIRECGLDGVTMTTSTTMTVTNNRIGPVYGWGADCFQTQASIGFATNGYFANNYMYGSPTSPKGCLILVGDIYTVENNYFTGTVNFHIAVFGSQYIVRGNVCYNCQSDTPGSGGAYEITDNNAVAFSDHQVYNNVFVDCNPAINVRSAGSANRSNIRFWANTIYNPLVAPTEWQVNFRQAVSGEFKDNIIWDGTGTRQGYRVASIVSAQTWLSDYNLIGPEATGFISHTGTSYNTLAAYVAGKTQDTHSIKDAPRFRSMGDLTGETDKGRYYRNGYHSSQRRAGTIISGATPPAGAVDIGALQNTDGYWGFPA